MGEKTGEPEDRDPAEIAYAAMAPFYDEFTAHHDHELWIKQILPRLRALGLSGNRLLDAACGTGKCLIHMLRWEWEVTGTDISPAMIDIAGARLGDDARLAVADVRDLPVLGEFDLVWAVADALNYLCEPGDLVAALTSLRRNLASDGLLLIDMNTLHAYQTFFAEEEIVEAGDSRLVWTGLTDPSAQPGVLAEASFQVLPTTTGGPRASVTVHRERHYPEAEVGAAIEQAGLALLDVFGHGYDAVPQKPLDEGTHIKAVYIAALPGKGRSL